MRYVILVVCCLDGANRKEEENEKKYSVGTDWECYDLQTQAHA